MKKPEIPLPELMKAVLVYSTNGKIEIKLSSLKVPVPKQKEVLVKIDYASINPSDLVSIKGNYGTKTRYPVVPGFEGAGTIVSVGKFTGAKLLIGKRVACSPAPLSNGTWAQYMVTKVDRCVPLLPNISTLEGASLLVNPLSSWALMNLVRKHKFKNVIISAASSSIGKMLIKLAKSFNLNTIALTSRQKGSYFPEILSPRNIINTTDEDFAKQIATKLDKIGRLAFLDCVGGTQTETIINHLPDKSKIFVFGALAASEIKINIPLLIFSGLNIEGFWLKSWLKNKNLFQLSKNLLQVQLRLNKELHTDITGIYHLDKVNEAIDFYLENRANGKVLLSPHPK